MNNKEISERILELVGGKENVVSVTHCITRLRIIVKNTDIIQSDEIKKLNGVMGDNLVGKQYQVILGPKVADIFKEFQPLVGEASDNGEDVPAQKKKLSERLIDTLTGIFVPILPAMIGAGLIKGVLLFLMFAGVVDTSTDLYKFMMIFSDAVYYFLPFLLACSTAEHFKTNKYIAMAIAGVLLHPDLITLLSGEGRVTLLGIPVMKVSYASSVVPIVLSIWFMSYVEKFFAKHVPSMLRTIAVPVLTILVTAPVTLWILGPIGSIVSNLLASNFLNFYLHYGIIAGALFSGFLPLMILMGIHNGFTPVMVQSLATYGVEYLMGLNVPSNSAQAGATFAVFLKTKNKEMKELAGSCAFSAILGITEPALYGVTAKLKKPLISVMIGGAVGGAIAGAFHVTATGMGTGPIIGIPLFFTDTFIYFVISCVVSCIVAFAITMVVGFDDPVSEEGLPEEGEQLNVTVDDDTIGSPVKGTVKPLSECEDAAFASGSMGSGVVIEPSEGKVYAPCDGEISTLFPTHHAIGITSKNGAEILIHVGMDTVMLDGEGFKAYCDTGDKVKAGQLLLGFDKDLIISKGLSVATPVIVTNTDDYPGLKITHTGEVQPGDAIIKM